MIDRTQSPEGSTLAQTQARAAANQSLVREVNERVEQLRPRSTFVEFVCECAIEGCVEILELTHQEYERLRSHANRFAVSPNHVLPQVEVVVDSTDRYVTVKLIGAGAAVARRYDPRHRKTHLQSVPEPRDQPGED